jgi:pilus assembly protein CpaF
MSFGRKTNGGIGAGLARTRPTFGVAGMPTALEGQLAGAAPPNDDEVAAQNLDPMAKLLERERAETVGPTGDSYENTIHAIKEQVLPRLLERIDPEAAAALSREELSEEFRPITSEVLAELRISLNRREQFALEKVLIDELLGLGPLEELVNDSSISDILINGPKQIYIERKGKLELTNISFRNEEHLFQIAQRICNSVGRRVDQTSPLADARLEDGSRVNVIIPPLSLKGTAISIRKFSAKPITLDMMAKGGNCSQDMANVMKIASACRLNIVISGGTGSGKTTLLNALSKMIDPGERVITIEDAAELRLQQPHVLTLETRPANLEGDGAITIRDLVVNALRMRPDRIILGEIRGQECFDMLQAMNTGHDGSMCTLHSNSPREALARMENMVMMSNLKVPKSSISKQIADSVDMIVQIKRMRDGGRRITSITEICGMEGDVIITQELFKFEYDDESGEGKIIGTFKSQGLRPFTTNKIRMFGYDKPYVEACI